MATTPTKGYTLSESEGILTAFIWRRLPFSEFKEMLISVKKHALKKNMRLMLLDMRVVDYADLTMFERHEMGLAAVEVLNAGDKLVCVAQKKYINKHGENVARNRGADVLVTPDSPAAINWLLN